MHYHHDEKDPKTGQAGQYVMATLVKNLRSWTVEQPEAGVFPVGKLGISHVVLVKDTTDIVKFDPMGGRRRDPMGNPGVLPGGGLPRGPMPPGGLPPGAGGDNSEDNPEKKDIRKTNFQVAFFWVPTPNTKEARPDVSPEEAAKAAAAATASPGGTPPGSPPPGT